MIPGTFAIIGGGSGKTANFVASRSSTSAVSTTYTFTNVPLGYYDPTRIIVLSVHHYKRDTSSYLNSASVGGVSATSRVSLTGYVPVASGSFVYCNLLTAAPTGATGTVSLTFSTIPGYGCAIGVWALYNVSSATPVSTSTAGGFEATDYDFVLSAQPNDLVIAAASGVLGGTATTWTNATENFDIINASNLVSSGAQRDVFVAGDPGVSFLISSNSTKVGVAGVWR